MSQERSSGDGTHRWRGVALSVALTLGCFSSGLAYATYATTHSGQATSSGPDLLVWLVSLAVLAAGCAWLWWRRLTPLALTIAASLAAIVLQVDASIALVGAVALIHYRRGKAVWIGVGAALAAACWAFVRDLLRPAASSVIATVFVSEPRSNPTAHLEWNVPLAAAVFTAAMAGTVIGLGLYWRSRRELSESRRALASDRQRSRALETDLARSSEREQIAREVHDTLGHDLSLISLQAAALELTAREGDLAANAQGIRTLAQKAHTSLSSLVELLRGPGEAAGRHEHVAAAPGLDQLAALLAESTQHGMQLGAVVLLADTDQLPPATGRAVYRIVQESLTNARRHASGAPVALELTGNQSDGLRLSVTNPLPLPMAEQFTPGNGLTGMRERVELAGGTMTAGPRQDGQFAVIVWLPWLLGE